MIMPLLGKRQKEDGEEELTSPKAGKSEGLFSDAFSSLSRTGRVRKKSAKLMEMESMGNIEVADDSDDKSALNKSLKISQGNYPPMQNYVSLNTNLGPNTNFGKIYSTFAPNQGNIGNIGLNNQKFIQVHTSSPLNPTTSNDNLTRIVMNPNMMSGGDNKFISTSIPLNTNNAMLIRGQMVNLQQNNNIQKAQQMILIRGPNPTSSIIRPQQVIPIQASHSNLINKNMLTLNTLNTMHSSSTLKGSNTLGGNINSHLILKGDPFLNQQTSSSRIVNLGGGNSRMAINVGNQRGGVYNLNNMINNNNSGQRFIISPNNNSSNIQISGLNLNARNVQILNSSNQHRFHLSGMNNNQLTNLRGILGNSGGGGGLNSSQKFTDVFANFVTQPTSKDNSLHSGIDHTNISPNKIMSAFSHVGDESLDNNDHHLEEDLEIDDQDLQRLMAESSGSLNDSLSAQFGLSIKGTKKRKKITAYTLWCVNQRKNLRPGLEFGQISKMLADMWSLLPHKEKLIWKRRAKKMTDKFQASLALEPADSHQTVKKRHYTPRRTSNNAPVKRGKYKKRGRGDPPGNEVPSQSAVNGNGRCAYEMNYTFRVTGTEAIDAAAYLKLLGECLTNLGERLMEHVGQIAVQGSLSVLLDSLICALGPLMCLTSYIPCHRIPQPSIAAIEDKKSEFIKDGGDTGSGEDQIIVEYGIDFEGSRSTMTNILDNIAYIMPGL